MAAIYKVQLSVLSWFEMIRQTLAAVLFIAAVGAGCTFAPVYGDYSDMSLAFDFGSPNTRLEQVVYNELSLRFASSAAPNTPHLVVKVAERNDKRFIGDTQSRAVGVEQFQVTVTATARILYRDKELFSVVRAATAEYETAQQVVAEQSGREAAQERAAKAAAESLRLAIFAEFPRHANSLRAQR